MKKIALLAGLFIGLCSANTQAQVRVNINIGAPVMHERWAAYDNDYYYMPGPGVYYNARRAVYVYPEGPNWVYASALPARYGGLTYRNTRYVRIHDRAPFQRNDYYRQQYIVTNNGRGHQQAYQGRRSYTDRGRGDQGHRRPDFNSRHQGRR